MFVILILQALILPDGDNIETFPNSIKDAEFLSTKFTMHRGRYMMTIKLTNDLFVYKI